jgi:UDP-glucose 4-epimerase
VKIVVTGGAGFIGANLVRELSSRDQVAHIAVIDDLSTGYAGNLAGIDAELLEASILDRSALDGVVGGAHSIVHLAAIPSVPRSIIDPMASHHANATGTLEVLEAARRHGVPHVVTASSSSVYGDQRELPKHEGMRAEPISPYAVSKLAAEAYTLAYGASYGLDVLTFRFFNVYGPLQAAGHAYAAVVPAFVDAALRGAPLQVFGDGEQTRDFTYVGTVCRVLADAAIGRIVSDEPVNLAFGTRTSLNELIALLATVLGREVEREYLQPRPGDVRDSQAANDRLRALFPGIAAAPLGEGLRSTVDWFRTLPDYDQGATAVPVFR